MKIGIFTQPLFLNYGGILQDYALQVVLRNLGHSPITIEKPLYKKLPLWRMPLATIKRFFYYYILRRKDTYIPFFEWRYNRSLPIIMQYTNTFIKGNIITRTIHSVSEIESSDYDAFIVGSDQVWRPKYNYNSMQEMFLTFSKGWNVKRIGYAISLGTDEWEFSQHDTNFYKPYAKSFDAISVRESSAVDIVNNHFNIRAVNVLDPTLLIPKENYYQLAIKQPKSLGTMMVHVLDDTKEKQNIILKMASDFNLTPFKVNQDMQEEDFSVPIEKRIMPPIEQWLRGFYDAEIVFTDSYHACIFSIIFNKPFIVFCNRERGATRFKSLLSLVGLERLLIEKAEEYSPEILKDINYKEVESKIMHMRTISMDFIKKALS